MSGLDSLFPGFEAVWLDGEEGKIFARVGGDGPPVVLVHGFPQTHAMWHAIAPALARTHRVICMDLRGYGWSAAPRSRNGAVYAKRAMGRDVVRVMSQLGHATFALVGHDRGARVGYRLALDEPGRLTKLALLDILPTAHVWEKIEAGAMPGAHWSYLSQPAPKPEEEIGRDPAPHFEGLMAKWSGSGDLSPFRPPAMASYRQSFGDPSRIHAMCEDYRAGATLDLEADKADLAAGRTIQCPVLLVWGHFYLTGAGTDPRAVWRSTFAPKAEGVQVEGGHFVAEEDPQGTLEALQRFLG